MSRKIDTDQITLTIQTIKITPTFYTLRNFRSCNINNVFTTEQRIDSSCLICLIAVTITHQCLQEHFPFRVYSKILFPFQFRETIKSSGQCQTFHILLVAGIQVDTLHKVEYTEERTIFTPFLHYALYSSFTYTFDSTKSETNITVMVYGKLQVTFIHIRSQRLNTHCFTFVHQFRDIGNVRQTSAHDSCHIFRRVIGFQIGCLVSYPRITSSM